MLISNKEPSWKLDSNLITNLEVKKNKVKEGCGALNGEGEGGGDKYSIIPYR